MCSTHKVDLLNDEFYVEMINMSLVDEGRYTQVYEADDRGSSNSPSGALIWRTINPSQWRGTSLDIDF